MWETKQRPPLYSVVAYQQIPVQWAILSDDIEDVQKVNISVLIVIGNLHPRILCFFR